MIFAVPVKKNSLCKVFGECDSFEIVMVDSQTMKVLDTKIVEAPPWDILTKWLSDNEVDTLLVHQIDETMENIIAAHGIVIIKGVRIEDPQTAVLDYLSGNL